MRHMTRGPWVLLLALGAAAGCAEVLGLDEPTIRDGAATGSTGTGGGDATTTASTSAVGSTGTDATTTSSTGATGGGGSGGGAGGGIPDPCSTEAECDDDNPCTNDACGDEGLCVHDDVDDGPLGADDPSDCVDRTCAGGRETVTPDDTEDPPDAVAICDTQVCSGGRVKRVVAGAGVSCGPVPLACDGEGNCGGCTLDAECGSPTACSNPTCDEGTGLCDPGYITGNLPDVVGGDCQRPSCTGSSVDPISVADDSDYAFPLPECTRSCQNGALRNGLEGASCVEEEVAGVCSGQGTGVDACKICRDTAANPDPGCNNSAPRCDENANGGEGTCGECVISDHCIGNPKGPLCVAGTCGCATDASCTSAANGSQCINGSCGCDAVSDCNTSPLGRGCRASGVCGCDSSAECTGLNGSRCINGNARCGCAIDSDCASGYFCDSPPTCSF